MNTLTRPRLRVVVLNYNKPSATLQCVNSVRRQQYNPADIVVVDNGSATGNARMLEEELPADVKLIKSPANLGYAAGNNLGCRATGMDEPRYVAILNNDLLLEQGDVLARLVDALESAPDTVAASPLVHTESTLLPVSRQIQVRRNADFRTCLVSGSWWLRRLPYGKEIYRKHIYNDLMPFEMGRLYRCESINGSCFVIRFDFLKRIEFLDEGTFLYFEEVILARQIAERRGACVLVTGAVVRHFQGLSTGQRGGGVKWDMYKHYLRSQAYYCRRYLKKGTMACGMLAVVRAIDFVTKAFVQMVAVRARKGHE